jgi:hypothetical protein
MALVTFREVKKALDICAPGHRLRVTTHRIKVYYNGLEALLPNGGHGPNEIKVHQVRKCANILGVSECMKRKLRGLGRNRKRPAP